MGELVVTSPSLLKQPQELVITRRFVLKPADQSDWPLREITWARRMIPMLRANIRQHLGCVVKVPLGDFTSGIGAFDGDTMPLVLCP